MELTFEGLQRAVNIAAQRVKDAGGDRSKAGLTDFQSAAYDLRHYTEADFQAAGLKTRGVLGGFKEIHIDKWAGHGDVIAQAKEHAADMRHLENEHNVNMRGAKNTAILEAEKAKHAAARDFLVNKHMQDLKWENMTTRERWAHRLNNVKSTNSALTSKITGPVKSGFKMAAKGAVIVGLGALAYNALSGRKKDASTPQDAVEQEAAQAQQPDVLTADAAMPQQFQPIGMGPKGPIYGEHTARVNGMDAQSMAIPPQMTAANFEEAGPASQKYITDKAAMAGQPALGTP